MMTMRNAFTKHALLAGLRSMGMLAALFGLLLGLATPAAVALAAGSEGAASTGGVAPAPVTTNKPTLATWFGPGFYGHTTACGQKMSPKLVGVASRTLPCGTLVQISYHGQQLTVPVLDRGPYGHNGATWDLTLGAARTLEIKETVHITTQIVGSVPNTPTLGQPPASAAPSGTTSTPATGSTEPTTATAAPAATGGAAAG
jgi:rare lipoprotein A (peptidoglycan hydrolase)